MLSALITFAIIDMLTELRFLVCLQIITHY